MRRLSLSLCLTLLFALPLSADGPETGTVSGSVADAGGSPLPGVSVTLRGERGDAFTQTDRSGNYRFALLVPGAYSISAELQGMGDAASQVTVAAGKRASIDLVLSATTEETITVVSEAPMVDRFNLSAGSTMNAQVGVEVTGENRTYYGVINFMPGVTNEDENADLGSTRPNINGATWADSTVYIDGVDTTFSRYGGSRVFLPSAVVTEVSLESGGMGVEYGRTIGSATNVIVKSGTNRLHAELLYSRTEEEWNSEYKDQRSLEARQTNARDTSFFKRTAEEKAAANDQYETALGGPIRRDKAWYFLSANRQNDQRTGKTVNGDFVDESGILESRIIKLNFQPGTSHQVAVNWIDTPIFRNFRLEPVFDRYAMTPHDLTGELYSLSWNWSLSNDYFLEAKLASQTSNEDKLLAFGGFDPDAALVVKQMDPRFAANPAFGGDFPGNNFSPYIDGDGWHNGWLLDNGFGTNRYPREQINVAMTQFLGDRHELRYGVDAQEVEWQGDVRRLNLYSGQGDNRFDTTVSTGFVNEFSTSPFGVACDFSTGDSCIMQDYNHPTLLADLGSNDTRSRNVGVYLRDRFEVGGKWVFNVGARFEHQQHWNDVGREVMDSADLSPRASLAYDLKGNGRQLITAYAGRSYHQLPQQAINEYLQDQFNGYNGYQRRLMIDCAFFPCGAPPFPFPLGYVFSLGFIRPGLQWDLVDAGVWEPNLDAYYKDEVVVGYEWQFTDNWALDVKGLWWDIDNLISSTTQLAEFNGSIDVFTLTANTSDVVDIMNAIVAAAGPVDLGFGPIPGQAFLTSAAALAQYEEPTRGYKALQMQLNRRFDDGWALYSNFTWGEASGSSHGSVFNNTNDSYGANLEQVMTQLDIDNCAARQVDRTVPVDCEAAWGPFLGAPLSIINRDGRAGFSRTVVAKTTGWKVFQVTPKQTFTLGGHATFQTGGRWNRSEGAGGADINPLLAGIPIELGAFVPIERRGAREVNSHWWLNLSLAYGFPVRGKTSGEVRVEIQNATNNQKPLGLTSSGETRPLRRGFQRPRRYRVLASLKF